MDYKNPTPVVVALIPCGEGLLALQRAIAPKIGEWAFPSGYIDEGENAETAATREVFQETGFLLEDWGIVMTVCTPDNKLLIFMLSGEGVDGAELKFFTPNEESLDLKVVVAGDELCFPLHADVLNKPDLWS